MAGGHASGRNRRRRLSVPQTAVIQRLHRRMPRTALAKEWRIFSILAIAIAALLGHWNGIGHPAKVIYDLMLRTTPHAPSDQIAVIAIDDRSIAALGRWPWPRRIHAHLIDILTEGHAKAVGLDILLSEPGNHAAQSKDDAELAAAMRRNGKVVLPLIVERGMSGSGTTPPLPLFADAAAGTGHTHFHFDEDGILRSVVLRERLPSASHRQFALALHDVGAAAHAASDAARDTAPAHAADDHRRHGERLNVPFAGTSGKFPVYSYHDVLSGKVPPSAFTGKYVLVGATATGIATTVPTPVTIGYRGMSGVEVNANILSALIEGNAIRDIEPWRTAVFGALATLLSLLACRYLSPLRALLCTLLLAIGVLLASWVAFRMKIWLPPGSALVMVLVIYPLWSWRRLEATLTFLDEEFSRLNRSTTALLKHAAPAAPKHETDFLDRRIAQMRLAASRAQTMQRFIADSLDSMPDATLVLSTEGETLMYNRTAKHYFKESGVSSAAGLPLAAVFARIHPLHPEHAAFGRWPQLLLSPQAGRYAVEAEARDERDREFLVKSASCRDADGKTAGWIVSLIDLTSLRSAQRHRDETLHFISHDMRSPQSSILALLELQKNPRTAFPAHEFYTRIERSVRRTLSLADDFVHLAKAKTAAYHLQEADFSSMLADATDDMWAYARSQGVQVDVDTQFDIAWVNVDRPMLVRAIGNLISNAIKFSPPGGVVTCTARIVPQGQGSAVECSVADQGDGIPDTMQAQIFQPFPRPDKARREGVGLGLAFVRMVIERHGGTVGFTSRAGKGSVFIITLPCSADTPAGQDAVEKNQGEER